MEENKGVTDYPECERRRQILDAANDLFLEFGYDGATLDMLIERTGGSRRTIYEHFGSKEGLLEAIVSERCMCVATEVETLSMEDLPPREFLQRLGFGAVRIMLSAQGVKLFRLVVQESGRNPRLGQLLYGSGVSVTQRLIAGYFTRQTEAGRLNVRHPEEAAGMFIAMIKGDLSFSAMFWGPETVTEDLLRQRVNIAVDIFLKGVQPE